MPASTIQNKREWNRSTFDDEDYGSAICLNFPKYAERLKNKIKVIAAAESKSNVMFIRDAVMKYIREKETYRRENKEIRGEMLWT